MPEPSPHEPAPSPAPRRGFTLTELLVVIAIIAILVSLTSVAVMTAMTKAKQTRIKVELDQIDSALKAYKDKYGAYPPCNLAFNETGIPSTRTESTPGGCSGSTWHWRFRDTTRVNLQNSPAERPYECGHRLILTFGPDQALVFWLQGFSSNPLRPIFSVNSKQCR